jgi:hypothetical protein
MSEGQWSRFLWRTSASLWAAYYGKCAVRDVIVTRGSLDPSRPTAVPLRSRIFVCGETEQVARRTRFESAATVRESLKIGHDSYVSLSRFTEDHRARHFSYQFSLSSWYSVVKQRSINPKPYRDLPSVWLTFYKRFCGTSISQTAWRSNWAVSATRRAPRGYYCRQRNRAFRAQGC